MTDKFEIETTERLARIEEQIKSLNGWMRDHITAEDKTILQVHSRVDLEDSRVTAVGERLAQVELWRARIGGVAAGVGIVSGVVTAVVTAIVMRLFGG